MGAWSGAGGAVGRLGFRLVRVSSAGLGPGLGAGWGRSHAGTQPPASRAPWTWGSGLLEWDLEVEELREAVGSIPARGAEAAATWSLAQD